VSRIPPAKWTRPAEQSNSDGAPELEPEIAGLECGLPCGGQRFLKKERERLGLGRLGEIFDAPDAGAARQRFGAVLGRFEGTVTKVSKLPEKAEEDPLTIAASAPRWAKLRFSNPLEQGNRGGRGQAPP
jgi:hypothetical protein